MAVLGTQAPRCVAFGLPGTECLFNDKHSSRLGAVIQHCILDLSSTLCVFHTSGRVNSAQAVLLLCALSSTCSESLKAL